MLKIISDFAIEYRSVRLQIIETFSREKKQLRAVLETSSKCKTDREWTSQANNFYACQKSSEISDQLELALVANIPPMGRVPRRRKNRSIYDFMARERQDLKIETNTRRAK